MLSDLYLVIRNIIPVHQCLLECLSRCSFIEVYETIRNAYRVVFRRLRFGYFGSQQWDSETRQCAVTACKHQTGIWTPVDLGAGIQYALADDSNYCGSIKSSCNEPGFSPQHTIQEEINSSAQYLVVCSTKCYLNARAVLRMSHWLDNVMVLRGTHLAHPRLLHRLDLVLELYEAHWRDELQVPECRFNDLIERLDVPMDTLDSFYCALSEKWRNLPARGHWSASIFGRQWQDHFEYLCATDKVREDIALLQICDWDLEVHSGEEEISSDSCFESDSDA